MRIGQERSSRSLGIVDVPTADTHSGEHDLTWCAEWHERQMLVDDIDVHIVDRATQRNTFAVGRPAHDLVIGVVRGLGEPVRVNQLDAGLRREPALRKLLLERLASDRHASQVRQLARLLRKIGQHDLKIGRHDLNDSDPCVSYLAHETLRVEDYLLLDDESPATDKKRGDQLP